MTIIGPGIEIGPGITIFGSSLVLDLDAANYTAVPDNGSAIAGSEYTVTVQNPTPRISWNSDNDGVFRVTTASTNNFMTFGPDYSSGTQAFTVGMAYKWNGATPGSTSTVADTAWHFIWFSSTGVAGATKAKSYVATNTAPTGTFGTSSANNGFNGLRLWGRFVNQTTSSEQVDADIGFVKIWNKELSLEEIQAEHAAYKTRFGY